MTFTSPLLIRRLILRRMASQSSLMGASSESEPLSESESDSIAERGRLVGALSVKVTAWRWPVVALSILEDD